MEQSGDLKNGREREKNGSPPTGQAETNSLKRPKTFEPHRALTASNSVVWQEPSPTLRCEAQRCGSDAIPPRGSQLAAMLVPRPRLPSHRVTRSGLEEGAHLHLTPCVSMKSRAKKIFHDSVEHTPNRTHTREGKVHSATVAALILTQCHTCTIKGHPASRADVSKTYQREGRAASSLAPQQLWEHLVARKRHLRESETWSGEHLRRAGVT